MKKNNLVKKIVALKMAEEMGCSGAHQDSDGNWMPCESMEELQRISKLAEGRNWRSAVPGYKGADGRVRGIRRRRRNDQWENLREKPIRGISTLADGSLVSGNSFSGSAGDGGGMSGKDGSMGLGFVRDNDPDVFNDIESARLRSRQLGCIGVSRRVSKSGRVVWTPCTNNSDYSRLAGTTSLGRRGARRDFERAVRTIVSNDLKRPKRKVSIYEELYK